jgi:hypothetical protein
MKVVYKYEFGNSLQAEIDLPIGFKIVRVAYQYSAFGKGLMIWAEVNPDEKKTIPIKFKWFMTGQVIEDPLMIYVTTLEHTDGYMFHLYRSATPSDLTNVPFTSNPQTPGHAG